MDFTYFLFKVVLALSLGGLIGVDRERAHHGYPAGIRTLAFISLLGMLASFITEIATNNLILPIAIATIFLLITTGYGVSLIKNKNKIGLTSTIIMLMTFFIGLISYYEEFQYFAIAIAIIITLVLSNKELLHSFARRIKSEELLDALKFGIVAFIILPILPNKYIDPFGVINPYLLWLMVVLILSISFAGYIASKFLKPRRALYLSGAIGGLVSSTAVTSSLSITAKKTKELTKACIVGITISSTVMFVRVFFETFVINHELAYFLLIPLTLSTIAGLVMSYISSIKVKHKHNPEDFVKQSPFNFMPALKFTLLLALVIFVSKITNDLIGESGTYITSLMAGLVDVDAITLSITSLTLTGLSYKSAIISILMACLSNNFFKALITRSLGNKELFKKVLINFLVMSIPLIIFIFLTF